jgi:hypothetical protein
MCVIPQRGCPGGCFPVGVEARWSGQLMMQASSAGVLPPAPGNRESSSLHPALVTPVTIGADLGVGVLGELALQGPSQLGC